MVDRTRNVKLRQIKDDNALLLVDRNGAVIKIRADRAWEIVAQPMNRRLTRLIAAGMIGFIPAFFPSAAQAISPHMVISQIYGGGGNSGTTYTNEFIELFNRGAAPVSLAGWTLQYASATGVTWLVTPLSGTVQPGQ